MTTMKIMAAGLFAAFLAGPARAADISADAFDVLSSVMAPHQKEINAKQVLEGGKDKAIRYREQIIAGWWEFLQVNSAATPGEFCAASFLRAHRLVENGRQDKMKDGAIVTLFGPGGNYRGALLAFSPLGEDSAAAFPKVASGKPVLVTLKQGNIKPVTLNAIYLEVKTSGLPLLVFPVPSIEALMKGMQDNWSFEVVLDGKSIVNVAWHDGLMARNELRKCLDGQPFDTARHWSD